MWVLHNRPNGCKMEENFEPIGTVFEPILLCFSRMNPQGRFLLYRLKMQVSYICITCTCGKMDSSRGVIGTNNLKSGFESETTPFSMNLNPENIGNIGISATINIGVLAYRQNCHIGTSLNPTQVCRPLATQPVKLLKCSEIYFFKNYCLSCSYCKKTHKDIIIVHGGQFLVKDTVIARNTIKKKGNNFHSYNNINVMFCFIMFIH